MSVPAIIYVFVQIAHGMHSPLVVGVWLSSEHLLVINQARMAPD
jgi:hypothetical protein